MTANLRALAANATPGPWHQAMAPDSVAKCAVASHDFEYVALTNAPSIYSQEQIDANAAFIAAASPDVVLAMLDAHDEHARLSELRGNEVAHWANESGTAKGERDQLSKRLDACLLKLQAMTDARDAALGLFNSLLDAIAKRATDPRQLIDMDRLRSAIGKQVERLKAVGQ